MTSECDDVQSDEATPKPAHAFLLPLLILGVLYLQLQEVLLALGLPVNEMANVGWWTDVANLMARQGVFNIWTPYPPIFPVLFYALSSLTGASVPANTVAWQCFNLVLLAGIAGLVFSVVRRRAGRETAVISVVGYCLVNLSWAGSILVGPWCDQFDYLPILLILVSLLLLLRGRTHWSAVVCGVGAVAKVFPAIMLFVAASRLKGRAVLAYFATVAAVALAVCLPFLIVNHRSFLSTYAWSASRHGWETVYLWPRDVRDPNVLKGCFPPMATREQMESLFAKPYDKSMDEQAAAREPWHMAALPFVCLAFLVAGVVLSRRSAGEPEHAFRATLLMLLIFLIFAKGISSYFVLWLMPFLCIVYPGFAGVGMCAALLLVGNLEFFRFPSFFWLAIWLRHFLLVVLAWHQASALFRNRRPLAAAGLVLALLLVPCRGAEASAHGEEVKALLVKGQSEAAIARSKRLAADRSIPESEKTALQFEIAMLFQTHAQALVGRARLRTEGRQNARRLFSEALAAFARLVGVSHKLHTQIEETGMMDGYRLTSSERRRKKHFFEIQELNAAYQLAWTRYHSASLYGKGSEQCKVILGKAVADFREFLTGNDDPYAYLGLALCYRGLGHYYKAMEVLDSILERKEKEFLALRPRALYNKARIAADLQDHSTVIEIAGQLIEKWPFLLRQDLGSAAALLKANSHVSLARNLKRDGDARGADEQYTAALVEVRQLIRAQSPHVAEATALLQEWTAEAGGSRSRSDNFVIAETHFAKQEYKQAAPLYDDVVAAAGSRKYVEATVTSMFKLGICYLQTNRPGKAAQTFATFSKTYPDDARCQDAAFLQVQCYSAICGEAEATAEQKERYASVIEGFLATYGKHPKADSVRFALAGLRKEQRDLPAAASEFEKIPESSERYVTALFHASDCRLRLALAAEEPEREAALKRASAQLHRFLEIAGESSESIPDELLAHAKRNLATLYADPKVGKYEEALRLLNGFRQVESDPGLIFLRLVAQAQVGRLAKAQESLELLLARHLDFPRVGMALRIVGAAMDAASRRLAAEGKQEEAQRWQKAGSRYLALMVGIGGEEEPEIQIAIANKAYLSGNYPAAARLYARTLEQIGDDPEHESLRPDTELRLAYARTKTGAWEEAAELFERALEREPDSIELRKQAAICYQHAKRYEKALGFLRELARAHEESTPEWYEVRYHIFRTYYDMGHHEKALRHILVTKELHPDMGGSGWQLRFLALEDLCKARLTEARLKRRR